MSWSPPNDAVLQVDESTALDASENRTKSFAWKGSHDALETAAENLVRGTVIVADTWVASSWNLRRAPAGQGVLTIECIPPNPESGSGTEEDPKVTEPLEDLWSIKSCRNDVSLLAYCGPSTGANPLREQLENWLKETDDALARNYQYTDASGRVVELTAPSKKLAAKFRKGVESVIRFYPVVTRKRIYADVPPACLENIGYVDTPEPPQQDNSMSRKKIPNGLSNAVDAHEWLKVQDDADEQSDGKWARVESWMGIAKTDAVDKAHPWDPDLYGSARWSMPADLA